MQVFKVFPNAQAARDYRHEHGTGGWIFAGSIVILFPPEFSPSAIFHHPFTAGKSGTLIA